MARLAILCIVVGVLCSSHPSAQMFPADDVGLAMGHVLLNVTDAEAHQRFWITQFDAKPLRAGSLDGVSVPGVVILFRTRTPTGSSHGSTINHLGLKVKSLAQFTARFDKAGYAYDPPRIGRESTPQTYVTGPDGFRMELVEDSRIPWPVVGHHLHYWLARPPEVKRWYVDRLLLKPTLRGPYESADLPGMNLTFAPLGTQKGPGVPTRGRLLDGIGFDVANLGNYVRAIGRRGVKLAAPVGRDRESGLLTAVVTDPWGATIRLTEGLRALTGTTDVVYIDGYVVVKD